MPDQPDQPTRTLAELADRFGSWRRGRDDVEISVPPYWTRGAELDGPPDGRPGSAYVTGADHRADWPGHEVYSRGAVAEWCRVVRAAGDGVPTVTIEGDDSVEVIGNDVRTVREPATIVVGASIRLTPLGALQLVDALMRAVELATDRDDAYATYVAAAVDDASVGTFNQLRRAVLADRGIPTAPAEQPTDDPMAPRCRCPLVRDERGVRRTGDRPDCPVHGTGPANDPAPDGPVIDRDAATACTCTPSSDGSAYLIDSRCPVHTTAALADQLAAQVAQLPDERVRVVQVAAGLGIGPADVVRLALERGYAVEHQGRPIAATLKVADAERIVEAYAGAPAGPAAIPSAAVCTCPDSWHHPFGKHHPDACPLGSELSD